MSSNIHGVHVYVQTDWQAIKEASFSRLAGKQMMVIHIICLGYHTGMFFFP